MAETTDNGLVKNLSTLFRTSQHLPLLERILGVGGSGAERGGWREWGGIVLVEEGERGKRGGGRKEEM
jgi:hypothetical protein